MYVSYERQSSDHTSGESVNCAEFEEDMAKKQMVDTVTERVVAEESRVLQSIGWVSIATAILYVCAVAWRFAYYTRLGVPFVILEFPFPDILIPRLTLLAFIANALLAFLAGRFYRFYEDQKRSQRAKVIGVTDSLEALTKYSLQKSVEPSHGGKTNIQALFALLVKYFDRTKKDGEEWTFNFEEFDKEIKPLFPDLPQAISKSFVWYGCQLFVMESNETRETLRDSMGAPPRGSKYMDALAHWAPWVFLLCTLPNFLFQPAYALRLVIFVLLGFFLGRFLAKLTEYEDRYQLWWAIWMSLVSLVILSAVDGYVTARERLSQGSLPTATIEQCDGMTYEGLLLADFSDGYVLFTTDPNDLCQCVKLHKQQVRSVKLTTVGWLRKLVRRLEEESPKEPEDGAKDTLTLVETERGALAETDTTDVNAVR